MIKDVFLHLCNFSVVTSLVVVLALVFRPLLKKGPSFIRCILWALIFFRLMIPVSFVGNAFSFPAVFQDGEADVPKNEISVPVDSEPETDTPVNDNVVTPPVNNVVDDVNGDFDNDSTQSSVVPPLTNKIPETVVTPPSSDVVTDKDEENQSAVKPSVETKNDESDTVTDVHKEKSYDRASILATVWLIGATAMLSYMLISHIVLRYRIKNAVVYDSRVRVIPSDCSPFVIGVIHPTIYIPASISKNNWRYIIAHEENHIKKLDHIFKPLTYMVLCVYWFNPFLWLAYIFLSKDIEYACDERTTRKMSQQEKKAYSMALLSSSTNASIVFAHPLAFGKVNVKERIKRVMNYKKSISAICFTLVICISLALVVACTPSSAPESSTEGSAENATMDNSIEDSASSEEVLTPYDMQGREFKILQRWFAYQDDDIDFSGEVIWVDDSESGELSGINLAKKQALDKVQSEYNCTITGEIIAKTPNEIRNYLEKDLLSGAPTVDFCFETYYYYSGFVTNGYFADLNTLGVDFTADWWDSGAVRDLSISGKQFYGIGDINTYDNDGTIVLLFNKDLYAKRGGNVAELYKQAAEGNWTFDVFKEKIIGFGEGDTYGLLSDETNLYWHLLAAGEKTVAKDDNDRPVFALDNERAIKAYNDALELYIKNPKDVLLKESPYIGISNPPDNTLDAFIEGRGLFYITTPSYIEKLDRMEDEYGILPMPKYDNTQESYCHTVTNYGVSTVFVPNTALSTGDKGKEIGILLDALGKYSKEFVTPVYLDETAPDVESKQMLEMILSTRVYDLGAAFSVAWNNPQGLCARLNRKLSDSIVTQKSYITSAIERTMSLLDNITVSYSGFNDDEVDFIDYDSHPPMKDYYSSVQISVKDTVKDFKYIKVFYDGNGKPYASDTLYSTESISPNDAFCVKTYIKQKYSNRGISYINDKGDVCYAVITYNSDGKLCLESFSNSDSFNVTVKNLFEEAGFVPVGTEINSFYVTGGVAHIDFNKYFKDAILANDEKKNSIIHSVVKSLIDYYGKFGVERVLITVNSASISKGKLFAIDNFDGVDDSTSEGKHYAVLEMFDVYAIGTYLYPVTFDGTANGLIAALVEESGWNPEIKVNSFTIKDRVAYIDMNKAFGDRVYAGLMAESGVTCVCETIYNYYGGTYIDNIVLTIEGEPFVSDYA